jgi:hypothetical protein
MNKTCFLLLLCIISLKCPTGSVVNACAYAYVYVYANKSIVITSNSTANPYKADYITTRGYNYDDSYIHKKNIFNVDNFVKPIAEKIIQIIAKIYNNRKILNSCLIGGAIVLGCTQNVHY